MKKIACLFFIHSLLQPVFAQVDKDRLLDSNRLAWFNNAKFGIFLHWGVYSGHTTESWAFFNGNISQGDYMANGKHFTAAKFDADKWADLFLKAGARYAVLTAMHCDGVTLFDSKYTKATTRNMTSSKRDVIADFVPAMQKKGLKAGLYYSHVNWSDPDYMWLTQSLTKKELNEKQHVKHDYAAVWTQRNVSGYYKNKRFGNKEKEAWTRFVDVHDGQVNELLSNYGKIDLLWFDFMFPNTGDFKWGEQELKSRLLEKNKDLIVNARLGNQGDYYTAERGFPVLPPVGPWEYCETLSDHWGYLPNDTNYKTPQQLVRTLAECIGMGGNFLLAIGPKEDGSFDKEHEKRLLEIGRWIDKHQEAVYQTKRGLPPGHFYGPTALTPDGKTLFLYLFDEPRGEIQLRGIRNKIQRATVVGYSFLSLKSKTVGGAPWANIPGTLMISVPKEYMDDKVTVLRLDFDEPIELYREKGRDIIVN